MAVETKKKSMCFSNRKRRKMAEFAKRNNNSNDKNYNFEGMDSD